MRTLLALLLSAIVAQAAPAFVDVVKDQTGSPTTSFTVNQTVASGNTIIVFLACSTANITYTITSGTGTYQQDAYENGGPADDTFAIWSSGRLSAGTHTLTIGVSASEFVRYAVMEWSDIADSGRVIAANNASATTASIYAGSAGVTTSTANTLILGGVRTDGDETAHGTISAASGYTLMWPFAAVEPEQKLMGSYRIVNSGTYGNSGGTPNAFLTMASSDGGGWSAAMVAYAPNSGGGDSTPPTVSTKTIGTSGTTLTLGLDETCSNGSGGSGGVTLSASGGAVTATYSSGSGSSSFVYNLSRTVYQGETVTVSYTQPGSGIEDAAGNDLATFSGSAVTNNSTQQQSSGGTGTARGVTARVGTVRSP